MEQTLAINCDYQFQDMVICALRYAIGRNTYVVDEVCEWVENHPEILDDRVITVMKRDVSEQIMYYEAHGVNSIIEMDYKRLQTFYFWLDTVQP